MGDPSGISTEITIKAWIKKNTNLKFFLIHDPVYVSRVIKKMKVGLKVQIINNPSEALSVNKKYLPAELVNEYENQDAKLLPPWDPMGALAQ